MKQKVLMIDLDGVLVDFSTAFTSLCKQFDPSVQVTSAMKQQNWDYTEINPSIVKLAWQYVDKTPGWWTKPFALINQQELGLLNSLRQTNEVIFCTSRGSNVCDPVSRQSIEWLEAVGIHKPSVVISKNKGEIARAIKATHSIEDRPQNAAMIHWLTDGKCKSYLIDRPYNEKADLPKQVKRVQSLEEFLLEVK